MSIARYPWNHTRECGSFLAAVSSLTTYYVHLCLAYISHNHIGESAKQRFNGSNNQISCHRKSLYQVKTTI